MKEIIKVTSGKDVLNLKKDDRDEPRQVFGPFLYEGEIGILFGDSNTGKSLLANEIAFFVSGGGRGWKPFTSPDIPSMYVDMEMTQEQFVHRYRTAADYLPDTYSRVEVDTSLSDGENLFGPLRTKIIQMQGLDNPPKLIIIDNITKGFGSILSPSKMRAFISDLKTLKQRFGLTILLIAHCPKRKKNAIIDDNSLGGSKMILNFVDSAFAIANTVHEDDVKYVKQIKVRTGCKRKDVMTVYITEKPYLGFKYMGWDNEECCVSECCSIDLMPLIDSEKEIRLVNMLLEGKKAYYEIAEILEIPPTAVIQYEIQNGIH